MAQTKDKGGKAPPPAEPPTKTGGGGDGDEEQGTSHVEQPTGMVLGDERDPVIKARIDLVRAGSEHEESRLPEGYEFSFHSGSLMGSWFHKLEDGEIIWQGAIVAEIGGCYLCQVQRLEEGCENVQILVPFPEMQDPDYSWRFYDSEWKATEAYQLWLLHERQRA